MSLVMARARLRTPAQAPLICTMLLQRRSTAHHQPDWRLQRALMSEDQMPVAGAQLLGWPLSCTAAACTHHKRSLLLLPLLLLLLTAQVR
jgi:hypothetical protein